MCCVVCRRSCAGRGCVDADCSEVFERQRAREREIPADVAVALAGGDDALVERLLASMPVAESQRVRARIVEECRRRDADAERDEHLRRASEAQQAVAERGLVAQDRSSHWRRVRRSVEDVAGAARVARDQALRAGDASAAVDAQSRLAAAQALVPVVEDATFAETGRRVW